MSARDMVMHRENTHEMFGYDFMVDTNLNVWLIEVNSSPSMEHSTVSTSIINHFKACDRETGQVNSNTSSPSSPRL